MSRAEQQHSPDDPPLCRLTGRERIFRLNRSSPIRYDPGNHIQLPSQPSSTVEPSGSLLVVVTVP